MTINDGGPAFPWHERGIYHGMTLRDWFAGQALAGIDLDIVQAESLDIAKWCYAAADAMLTAREVKP
jgi:hypothetical protein